MNFTFSFQNQNKTIGRIETDNRCYYLGYVNESSRISGCYYGPHDDGYGHNVRYISLVDQKNLQSLNDKNSLMIL